MTAYLGPNFWAKLSQISKSVGMDPSDLLAVMYYESRLDPSVQNAKSNATGLIQFMPDTMKGLGFSGTHQDFKQLDAEQQLDYVEKYVKNQMRFNNGPFKSATQYYVANLWPVALRLPGVKNQDLDTPILEKNPTTNQYKRWNASLKQQIQAYNANTGLDKDKDGVIRYGDLDNIMRGVKSSSGFQYALQQLNSGGTYIPGQSSKQKSEKPGSIPAAAPKEDKKQDFYSRMNALLDTYIKALS